MTESAGEWRAVAVGVRRRVAPDGPWFQYDDPVGFEWNVYQIKIPDLPDALDGYRIVHLSDLHCGPKWLTAYDDLLDRLTADEPDLIAVTGDVVDDIFQPWKSLPVAEKLLARLRARDGVLAVRGNHDLDVDPREFRETPVRFVDGQRMTVAGGRVEVVAIPGPEREDFDPRWLSSLPPKTAGIPRIVLSHYPDHIRTVKRIDPDLFLSGHTHGGQVCLPGRITLWRHDSLPLNYSHGVHRYGRACLVVSRGFGFSSGPVRVFCPAEVIEIRLVRA